MPPTTGTERPRRLFLSVIPGVEGGRQYVCCNRHVLTALQWVGQRDPLTPIVCMPVDRDPLKSCGCRRPATWLMRQGEPVLAS
jgi:hypothetical protein